MLCGLLWTDHGFRASIGGEQREVGAACDRFAVGGASSQPKRMRPFVWSGPAASLKVWPGNCVEAFYPADAATANRLLREVAAGE